MSKEYSDRELPPDLELNRDAARMAEDGHDLTVPQLMVKFALRWVRNQRERAEKAEAERNEADRQLGRRQDALDIILNCAKWRGKRIKELKAELEAARLVNERESRAIVSLRGQLDEAKLTREQQEQALAFLKQLGRYGNPIWDVPHNGKPFFYGGYRKINTGFISEVRAFLKSMGIQVDAEDENGDIE